MAELLLAGDIGGTKTDLGLYRMAEGHPQLVRNARFASREHGGLAEVLDAFLTAEDRVAGAAFGIAGPVEGDVVQVTNLPWRIEAAALAQRLGCPVRLLNDLEATAIATLDLEADACEVLQAGAANAGNRCVLAAGTGLGQAFVVADGDRCVAIASEGGHADFAPRNTTEMDLLRFLLARHPRVSYETVLSGPGLQRIFGFVSEVRGLNPSAAVVRAVAAGEGAPAIGSAALEGTCAASRRAVEMFVEIYGAQAGNLALTTMARGGVYLAGGIVLHLLPFVRGGAFLDAFRAKAPFGSLMESIPVRIVLDAGAARIGAARAAAALA